MLKVRTQQTSLPLLECDPYLVCGFTDQRVEDLHHLAGYQRHLDRVGASVMSLGGAMIHADMV